MDRDQRCRIPERRRLQERSIDGARDGRGGADAETEAADG
jgi:hypothetical protein